MLPKAKVIVAGSRAITDYTYVASVIVAGAYALGIEIHAILHGGADGVDTQAERYADVHHLWCITYPAEWSKYGKAAGPIRNNLMVQDAEAMIAVWDGHSPGTRDIIRRARAKGIPVYVQETGKTPWWENGHV